MKIFISIFFLASAAVYAQDSLKTRELQEVVVTGEVDAQSLQKSVYNVRTISMERLQAQGATRLQDVLNTELNIRFSQDLALGGSNLSMLGLPGQNVKVLLDGVPIVGRQGTGNEININQINISTIERVEIIEGPMAVAYGADALAGVINIITKKADENKLHVSCMIHEESAGHEYGATKGIHNETVNLSYRRKSFYASGNLNRNDFRGWKGDSTGREETWHPKTQWLAGGVVGYRKNGTNVYYRVDYLNEKIYNPAQFSGNEAIDQNYITNRLMHQVQVSTAISERLKYNAAFSYTDYTRRTQSIAVNKTTGRETLADATLQSTDKFNGATIRGTLNYKINDHFSLLPGYDFNAEVGSGQRLKSGNNTIRDYAGFISANIQTFSWLSLRAGVRFEHNSVYNAPPAIPAVNLKIAVSARNDIRISYGKGFRAPSIRELYFNFFDASHSIEGNPDLKAELSHSLNLSWNSSLLEKPTWKLNTAIAGFYNSVSNMIDYGQKSGSNVTTYINIAVYRSQGLTWNNTFKNKNLEAKAGFAYTGRHNQLTSTDRTLPQFTWSPEVNGSLAYSFVEYGVMLSAFYKYTGVTPVYIVNTDGSVRLGKTAGFQWADLSVQKKISRMLTLSAGTRNLFNTTSISSSALDGSAHSGSGTSKPVGYGRSYFVTLNFQFNK